jgi:hypothetical protein
MSAFMEKFTELRTAYTAKDGGSKRAIVSWWQECVK